MVLRFLQPTARDVGEFPTPLREWAGGEPPFRRVESLRVGDRILHAWQEAEERTVAVEPTELGAMQRQPARRSFAMPVRRWLEPVHAAAGIVGVLVREQQAVQGSVELSACEVAEGVWKLTVRVANRTPWDNAL